MLSGIDLEIFNKLRVLNQITPKIFKAGIEILESNTSERVPYSAHSMREVIYILTELDEVNEQGSRVHPSRYDNFSRMDRFRENFEYVGIFPDESDILLHRFNEKLDWFSSVAHHTTLLTDAPYKDKLEKFKVLLSKILKLYSKKTDQNSTGAITDKNANNPKEHIIENPSRRNQFKVTSTEQPLFLLDEEYIKKLSTMTLSSNNFPGYYASYLLNMVPHEPKQIARIILSARFPEDVHERDHFLLEKFIEIAIAMPPKYGKQIARRIHSEKWLLTLPDYLDQPIIKLIKRMTAESLKDEAINLTNMLLDVDLGRPYIKNDIVEKTRKIQDVDSIINDYCYREFLEKEMLPIFEKFPEATTRLLIRLVEKTVLLENIGKGNKNSRTDASAEWRPAIEDHGQNPEFGFKSPLVGKLGFILVAVGRKSIPLLKRILEDMSKIDYPVFRRLELHVYRNHYRHFRDEIESAVKNYFDVYELHHEYFNLLKDTFPYISDQSREKYLSYVDNGPDEEQLEFWRWLAQFEKESLVELRITSWKVNRLKPVIDYLNQNEKERFADFIGKKGFTHPEFRVYHEGASYEEPVAELKDGWPARKVLEFLRSHKPNESDYGHQNAVDRKFQDYVQNQPFEFSKLAPQIINLNPNYIVRFFDGIQKAARQEKNIDWEPVLSLCKEIVESEKHVQEYEVFRSMAIAINASIGMNSIDFQLRDEVWTILKFLVALEDTDPTREDTNLDKDQNYFLISWKTINGISFHLIFGYAIWCKDQIKKNNQIKSEALVQEVKELISKYLEHEIPPSVSRHAVLGHYLSTLYYFDKKLFSSKLDELFANSNESLSRSAWEGYLEANVYKNVFADLVDKYAIHIQKLKNPSLNDDHLREIDTRVIEHVTLAYLFKDDDAKKLFDDMILNSHEKVRSHCAGHISMILRRRKDNLNRYFNFDAFEDLWRSNQLPINKEIRDWFRYSPLDKELTLELLYNSLEKVDDDLAMFFPIRELGLYAKAYPKLTAKLLGQIIEKDRRGWRYHNTTSELKDLLRILLDDDESRDDATALVYRLLELGFSEFEDLLEE